MDGLGIDLTGGTGQEEYQQPYHGHPAHAPHLRRSLHHSVSLEEGLSRLYHHQAMSRQPSADSEGSGKRVRIASGTPEVLGGKGGQHHHQYHHLSPLSDFSSSDTGSSQPFSPASLSELPSSTESGAHPTFYTHAPPPLHHAPPPGPTAAGMQASASRPYAPLNTSAQEYQPSRPSRLPAFLQERQRNGAGLTRPQSMMELGQAYSRPTTVLRGPRAEEEHVKYVEYEERVEEEEQPSLLPYEHNSPVESVPSSAGGLQRRNLERQLAEQKLLLEQERRRLRASEGRPRERPNPDVEPLRPFVHQRSRSLSAQEMRQLADAEAARAPQQLRRSQSQGFPLQAGLEEDLVVEDEAEADEERDTVISLDERPPSGSTSLQRQSTLLTAGASTVRRRKELNRLLAPTGKKSSVGLPSIMGSPTPSSTSSAVTASTRQRAPSSRASEPVAIASPVCLEQAKGTSRARVELDLVLETPLVVEGGLLKGKLELRVRKPKDKEGEVWIGKPKIRVIGFEELGSNDARYIFFHHAESISSTPAPNAPPLNLACFDSQPDPEGYCRAKLGQHVVSIRMALPVGKGAKGPWKGKQGVVRYIAIASVKLKSKTGSDRSIAHFYRHLDVFPYFNPALILAPAVKPLEAEAAKSLFMGGNGKVSLKASIHRETWVAGQRCYVDVRVENESNKKIKTLTLALIRTTTIYRPAAVEGGASHTQSTKKKIAETTLEMGKKGTKGVTAKGSWMGVDAGESADFSHSLLVPPDALSIARGRHVEVAYAVKVSVSGSLSADVTAEIPVRIIDFVSLDPPPGHIGASPVSEQQFRPVARSWSSNQLRPQQQQPLPLQNGPLMNRMVSVDSLRLEDLNGGRGPSRVGRPMLSRVPSADSIRTNDLPRGRPVEDNTPTYLSPVAAAQENVPPTLARTEALVDRALQRQLQHQMSLDCISSAIASATARRSGLSKQPSPIQSEASSAEIRQWAEADRGVEQEVYYGDAGHGEDVYPHEFYGGGHNGIQLDDLDEVPDDPAFLDAQIQQPLFPYEDEAAESDDELDAILSSHFSDDEDGGEEEQAPLRPARPPPSPRRYDRPIAPASPTKSPSTRPRISSPVKQSPSQDSLRGKRSPDKFAFATPSSPVKAHVELPEERETDFPPPPVRTARPLPIPPSAAPAAVGLTKQPSATSLRRTPGIIRKSPSTRSLRSVASSVELGSRPYPAKVALPPSRSPSIASPRVSPVLATVRTRPAMSPTMPAPSSPRKVVKTPSPALRATRSMADLHGATPSSSSSSSAAAASSAMPPPPISSSPARRSSVLPSVKNKVAALETRQATLTRLATTSGRARVSSAQLARADSVASNASFATSEASFKLSDLTRANSTASFASFKAPILRRHHHGVAADAPPLPPLPSSAHE